jgi:hypothetical protein
MGLCGIRRATNDILTTRGDDDVCAASQDLDDHVRDDMDGHGLPHAFLRICPIMVYVITLDLECGDDLRCWR